MPHQFKFKAALLTYSQVDNDTAAAFLSPKEAHFNHVADALQPPVVYRLGRESHADGGTHYHVFLSFDKRVSFRNERTLDFGTSHPNIKPIPRTPHLAFDYAGKDDDIIYEHGERPGESGAASSGRDGVYGDALASETKEGFLEAVRHGAPRDYVLYFGSISSFADTHYSTPPPPYDSPEFETNGEWRVSEWLHQSGIGRERGRGRVKSLALWGPSLTGKTLWARSLGRYVTLTSFTIQSDTTRIINPTSNVVSQGFGTIREKKFWQPGGKIIYDDDEAGSQVSRSSGWSVPSFPSKGNMYIFDLFTDGMAHTADQGNVARFLPQGIHYWVEG